ncbi:hypothetical protein TREMEDRAFT_57333 [Tremella mesenterica DSM 1558]|uniref:uncharacterized protein n=1 Tax=Tremella mesenterica (strain ATCC 24925 / CBS 8224 / DSM 1558 / NBRC 9311 / NRRL Y-6157 / RJB 2259-6 / UBC 559-6) TaxID=578456 RepID=UPI0003F49BA0|nr:uncharacterized protein TREMEDRAFT_57333 [Tremella mesenterica DSM 1558]EIW68447.1 hypothetical protein TREMEDRAFT_57333 [Tremella mesenterica DSM 1558]
MTKEHIATGWRKSGLHPFNPNVVYRLLSTPTETPTRPLLHSQSSASITSENDELLRNTPAINATPIKKRLIDVTTELESERSERTIVEMENKELHALLKPPKRQKSGATVGNLGTHNFTGGTVLERLREIEAAAEQRKKGKQKNKGGPEGREDRTEGDAPETITSVIEQAGGMLEVLESSQGPSTVRHIILCV